MSKFLEKLFQAAKESPELAEKLKRAENMGYDLSQVYYHGSPRADIGEGGGNFIPSKTGRAMYGEGSYFTSDPSYASDFAESMHIDEIGARNLSENPMFGATDVPGYNKKFGQTVYPVFLKKSDFDINSELDQEVKNNLIKVLKKENPEAIHTAKKLEDNYNLLNYTREVLDAQQTSDLLKASNKNTIGLPHGHKLVINPDENVKSVFAEFKNKKGLMSGVAPVANYVNQTVDANPVNTLKRLYSDYKDKQEQFVEPTANRLASDLSFNQEGPVKSMIKTGATEFMDPVNYVEGIPGALLGIMNLFREEK